MDCVSRKFLILISMLALTSISSALNQSINAVVVNHEEQFTSPKAPIVTSDGNVYVVWWTNKTGNNEILIRASNDGGLSFGEKINLSNTTASESVDAEIAADGENVYVTWWERNSTANEPVARISNDSGNTFGPILNLATNGTIGNNEE